MYFRFVYFCDKNIKFTYLKQTANFCFGDIASRKCVFCLEILLSIFKSRILNWYFDIRKYLKKLSS